jgi:hypothetical protein
VKVLKIKLKSLILVSLLLLISIPSFAQQGPGAEDWITDIDYMIARLEISHPNMYAMVTKEDFQVAADNLKQRIPHISEYQRTIGLMELVAMIQDGHTEAIFLHLINDKAAAVNNYQYLIHFNYLSDGLFIRGIESKHSLMLGKKVIKFNGTPTEDIIRSVYKTIAADNDAGRSASFTLRIGNVGLLEYCGLKNVRERLTLTLQNIDETEFDFVLENPSSMLKAWNIIDSYLKGNPNSGMTSLEKFIENPLPLYKTKPENNYWFKYFPEHKALYVKLLHMEPKNDEDFEQFYARMFKLFDQEQAEKLILDVRLNNGGNHYEMPLIKGIIARPYLDKADKLFVITGRKTFSASQHFVNQFDMYTNATRVGEDTPSKPNFFGAMRLFNLPRTNVAMRTSVAFHQDDTTWNFASTTQPHFYTPLSSIDFATHHDPSLELILNFDKVSNLPTKFENQLAAAYQEGTVDDLKSEYARFKEEYGASGVNLEMLMYIFLDKMFEIKRDITDYGLYVQFFTEQFPDSTEAWYYLGVSKKNEGNLDEAKENFRKSVKAHPMNIHAKRNLNLILLQEKTEAELNK